MDEVSENKIRRRHDATTVWSGNGEEVYWGIEFKA